MSLPELARGLAEAFARGGPGALRAACGQALMDLRGLDGPGAQAVLDQDPELIGLWSPLAGHPALSPVPALASALALRLMELSQARACLGCGTCCRTSSPTLYAEDLACLEAGGLEPGELVTLRRGELAHSSRLGRTFALEGELVKLREGPRGWCLRLAGSRCAIYERRPRQCRHLECWSGRHAGQLEDLPRLDRRDIYAGDDTALALIEEYEVKLSAGGLTALFLRAASAAEKPARDQAAEQALELVALDGRLRAGISERYGYPPEELDLLLGRPSWELARGHGLFLEVDQQGRPAWQRRPIPPN